MLCFLFLLIGLTELQTDNDSEMLHVQITIPEKVRSLSREGIESNASYNIIIEGNTYTVNLKQKAFLPHDFRVYGYNGTGYMKVFQQQIQNFCYYQGNIEGYPNSMAILSTCTGLRGLLQFENVTYGIEPLEPSVGFEHVIYKVKHKNTDVSLYAETDSEPREIPYKIQNVQPLIESPQYIEMHVVVEKYLYNHMGADTDVVVQKIFHLIGLTNAIFTSFNITVILSSLELWIDENKIPVTGDANELLHRFLKWKRAYLVLRPHDVAYLLVYREKTNFVGATFQGKMCDRQYGVGIALHPKTISLESLAVIIAQLLSLSMGIAYDDINKCQCSGGVCIMNPEAIHSSGVKIFSNCSMKDFARFISKPKSQCLQNHPRLDPSYKVAVCGNKIVEEGEACDCGSQQDCEEDPNSCCQAGSCKLKDGNSCDTGPCCQNCQYSEKGEMCRTSFNECDLPEYCNGSSASCQDNFYVQNGHLCEASQSVCLGGKCMSLGSQCVDTFGEALAKGPAECFQYLNSMTDESGSCGSSASGYTKCQPENIKCGKLICKLEEEKLFYVKDAAVIYSNVNGHICIALDYKYDSENSEKMWVRDGTVCGSHKMNFFNKYSQPSKSASFRSVDSTNGELKTVFDPWLGNCRCGGPKLCRNKVCVDNDLAYDCTEAKCNFQGVCNNKKNCHCNYGYLPPDCQSEQQGWSGGSVDSGNFPISGGRSSERLTVENIYPSKPMRWPFFLLIPFCIILSVMIATLVKIRFQRKKWKTEEYTSDEDLESQSESNSSLENRESMIS